MNANRTGRASSSAGAVMVRPTRLPLPSASVKRYQYNFAGFRPPTSTRQVQSASAEIGALAVATTCWNASSSATSTFNFSAVEIADFAAAFFAAAAPSNGGPKAAVPPSPAANSKNSRRPSLLIVKSPGAEYYLNLVGEGLDL